MVVVVVVMIDWERETVESASPSPFCFGEATEDDIAHMPKLSFEYV